MDLGIRLSFPSISNKKYYIETHIMLNHERVLLDIRTFSKMLSAVDIKPCETVLDLGCGFGYSSAIFFVIIFPFDFISPVLVRNSDIVSQYEKFYCF